MNHWVAFRTIVVKEVRRFTRIWPQTLLPPAVTTSLYFLIFGKLIGDRIGEIDGASYMEYIVPGVILMSVISHSYANVVASFYSTKFQRNIEELLVSPVPNWVILAGYVSGGIVRGIMVGLVVTLISLFFTDISVKHVDVSIAVFLLTATLFALAGFINAVFAESFDDIAIIPSFVLTPLSYLGGVFYSISLLPEFWQSVSVFNPILYMVNAFRFGMLGTSDINIGTAFLILTMFILALFSFCLYLLHKGTGIKT